MPRDLTHSSARVLEFDSLLDLLRGYASSPLGQARIAALAPSSDRAWIEAQQELASEIREFRRVGGRFEFSGLLPTAQLVAKSRILGAILETTEIRDVILVVDRAAEWREISLHPPASMKREWRGVSVLSAEIADFNDFLRYFRNKIQPDGTLEDHASPELVRIRREIEKQRRTIQDSLRGYLRRLAEGGTVQDELISIRGERFVIPIKVEQKRRVQGVVHGASSSGQTVYVEPLETIEQNNELVRLMEEEHAEIHRIFVALTRQVGLYAVGLVEGARVLALVDSLQARARFARDFDCVAPAITPHVLTLKAGRHPLLEKRLRSTGGNVVPLTLELTEANRQLIISGPNTGGKTVTLKTTALLAMMAQAGLPIPASAAGFSVFTAFLADIGDAQSIEAALSTFSAHITNLDRLARLTDSRSLVLLDELGSATDPEEGSALAVAIASYFLNAGAWSLISTHHTSLKVYAANTPGVLNAAAGVDESTLAPNYQLRLGVPGASAGIQTAERLGLNAGIVAAARQRLGSQQVDIARFLDKMHSELAALEVERKNAREQQYALNQERAKLAREGDVELRNRTRELETKLGSLLRDFEFQMRENVRAIEDRAAQQKLSKEAERRINRLRREFQESFNQTVVAHRTGADAGDANAQPHLLKHVAPGDQVLLKSMNKIVTVQREVEKDIFEVALGTIKMRAKREDLCEVQPLGRESRLGEKADPLAAARRQKK